MEHKLSNALGHIDEHYINEAVSYTGKKRRRPWIKWISAAACLAIVAGGAILRDVLHSSDPPDNDDGILSYFVITAHAADGESTQLSVADSCFNSVPADQRGNIFGVDMPCFNFSVSPSDLKGNEAIYSRFDISVSYNGTHVSVTDKDEHIMIAYLVSMQKSDKPWAYSVIGWFDEPTDIIVHIIDKESRAIVETITVSVAYDADRQGYDLEIVNLSSEFADQRKAVEASNVLMGYVLSNGYEADYPAWFGGCYIEDDQLHVKLVSPTEEERKSVAAVLSYYDDVVVFEHAEASVADLQKYADRTANELIENGYAVTSWYVDSITGHVVISVLEEDFSAALAWVDATLPSGSAPQIEIQIGEYISPDIALENETVEFCADPFLQHMSLSWVYSINVRIDNGKFYLNECLYDKVSYVENHVLDFNQLIPALTVDKKISEELDKINSQTGCYILETESASGCGKTLLMYVIGDTYYFIRLFENGTVMRIHSGTIQQ